MNQQAAGALAGMLLCVLVLIAAVIIIHVLFLLNLQRTLNQVRERNREMSPGLVWLNLIPLFNIIWNVVTAIKIPNSIEKEYEDRGWNTSGEGFARTSGMIWGWGGVANIVLSIIQNVAQALDMMPIAAIVGLLSLPISIAVLVCWIMFWVQTHQYKVRLRQGGREYEPGSLQEDYDDDYRPLHRDRDHDRGERRDRDYENGRDRGYDDRRERPEE